MKSMYNNPPAFQFYPQDFLTGVMYLTMEERGLYITLLSIQWSKNVIPKKRLALILGMEWENVPELIKEKFIDKGDYLINERLFNVSEDRKTYVEKQRLNGQKGGRPKTQTKAKKRSSLKMKMKIEDEIENIDIVYPYLNDEFIQIWNQFKIYKQTEFNFKFKSTQSEQAALSKLPSEMDNVDHAIQSIKNTMANGWKGIFPDKQNNNGTKNNTNTKRKYSADFERIVNEKIRS
jgi:uncharacterized protein YdaU (DUF1376 family)/uncharacterized protein YegP (UPF0339 family)